MDFDWDTVIGAVQSTFSNSSVTYMPSIGAPFGLAKGTFENGYQKEVIFSDGSVGVTTVLPTLGVQLSEFPVLPKQNDRLFVAKVNSTYSVREIRPDGLGWAKLMLNKVSSP